MDEMDLSSLPAYCSREFDPTAEELIGHYLKNHILKQFYPESGTIQEETIYGEDIDPWDKFCDPRNPYPWVGPTLYLFTRLSDVGITDKSSSIQKNRKSGCGCWHGTSSLIEVTSSSDEDVVIGHYRILSFRSKEGMETKGQWILYEYRISDQAFPEIRKVRGWRNQVVCRIKRDDNKSSVGGKVVKWNSEPKKLMPDLPKKVKSEPEKADLPKKRKYTRKAVSNKRRRTDSEVEEKPVVVVVEDGAGFVSHDDDQGCFGELSDNEFLDHMDELFDLVDNCA